MAVSERPPYDRTAERPAWADLPDVIRAHIASRADSPVLRTTSAGGGFTRGFAGLLDLADGTSVFVKAASHKIRPIAATSYAREAEVLRALPPAVPAPALLWSELVQDWQVLGIVAIPGARMPGLPWSAPDLVATVRACETYAAALRASPPNLDLQPMTEGLLEDSWSGWFADIAAGRATSTLMSPWAQDSLGRLHDLVQSAAHALIGDDACHGDLRPDNIVVDQDGLAWICDWNWLARGPVWADLVGLLVTVHADAVSAQNELVRAPVEPADADRVLAKSWLSDGLGQRAGMVVDERVDAFLALIAAFMCAQADDPVPDFASSMLAKHRAYVGSAALSWLEHRLTPPR